MVTLYIVWQDPSSRTWIPVGRLTRNGDYEFVYTKGALRSKQFIPFGRMTNLSTRYRSHELFPLFANRLLSKSRPEYQSYLGWLGTESGNDDPLTLLARSGGLRATDSLMMYVCPEPTRNGKYELHFLSHGISHLPPCADQRIGVLEKNERVFPMFDVLNPYDPNAVALRTDDPPTMIGYCPRFVARDVRRIFEKTSPANRDSIKFVVERVNQDAPHQFKLLCKMTAPWPRDFSPCSDPEFMPLAEDPQRRVL